jgi:hypothetical protein
VPQITGSVLGVEGRSVNGKTIYDVAFSDGVKYATFKQPVADAAQRLVGQPAVADVTVKQKGQYMNYYLDEIAPGAGASQLPLAPAISPIPVNTGVGRSPEVEQRIVRQNVIGTAFNFIAHVYTGAGEEALAEAKGHALALAKELYSHAFHGQAPHNGVFVGNTLDGVPGTQPRTSPEVAAQVNEVVGAPAVAVGTPDW